MLHNEPEAMVMGQGGATVSGEEAQGAVFDFEDLQALREEYEERLRRLEREKDAALDVVRRDAGQRVTALRAEQEARLAAESEMRQQLIEELTIELASAREEGERVAQEACRRRLASEEKLRWALGEVERLAGELARVREVLHAHLTPPIEPAIAAEVALLPDDERVRSIAVVSTTSTAALAARRKKIRLR